MMPRLFILAATVIFSAFTVRAAAPAQRVIALSPALTEIVYALGLQDKLVGVSDFSDYPPEAKKKFSVGPYTKPVMEELLIQHPDLVLLPLEGPEDVKKRLDRLHVHYEVINMKKIDEVGRAAEKVASLLGDAKKGADFRKRWEKQVKEAFTGRTGETPNVLIEIQNTPFIAAGHETFLDEIVTGCGGRNVVKEKGYPHLSLESLVKSKIDVILLADYFPTEQDKISALQSWHKFPSTKTTRAVVLDPDTTTRPGPRLITGINSICNALKSKAGGP